MATHDDNEDSAFTEGQYWYTGAGGYYKPTGAALRELPAGYYRVHVNYNGEPISKYQKLDTDDLLLFDKSIGNTIIKEIQSFWTNDVSNSFADHGFLHRRGYLLYGAAGCGKTSLLQLVIKDMIAMGGLVYTSGSIDEFDRCLQALRKIEPNRPVVCIFEDIDSFAGEEEQLLSLLDGENQVNHVINIATTNKFDELSPRISSRPRRFDRVIEIKPPTAEIRRTYLLAKSTFTDEEVTKWVEDTDGFSFAALVDLIITVKCLKRPYNEALKALQSVLDMKSF